MNPECPHYIPPRYIIDPETDKDYEGSAMCKLVDEYCLVEQGFDCEEYEEFLREVEE